MKLRNYNLGISDRLLLSYIFFLVLISINLITSLVLNKKTQEVQKKIDYQIKPYIERLNAVKITTLEIKMFTCNWVFFRNAINDKNELIDITTHKYPFLKKRMRKENYAWNAKAFIDKNELIIRKIDTLLTYQHKIQMLLNSFTDYDDPIKKFNAELILEQEIIPKSGEIFKYIEGQLNFLKKEESIQKKILNEYTKQATIMYVYLALIALFLSAVFSVYFSNTVTKPIQIIQGIIESITKGKIEKVSVKKYKGEIGDMLLALKAYLDETMLKIEFANSIGAQQYNKHFNPTSADDELGKALLQMRDSLLIAEKRIEELQELTGLSSWIYDIKTAQYTFPLSTQKLLKLNSPLLEAKDALKIIHPDFHEKIKGLFKKAIQNGSSSKLDLLLKINEAYRTFQLLAKPTYNAKNEIIGFEGTILDVEDRKLLEQTLRDAKEKAERADHVKTRFLSNISHEIRTPLHAILGFTELISIHNESALEPLEAIRSSAKNLLVLINEILDFSKVESGTISIKEKEVVIPKIIEEILEMCKLDATRKGIQLSAIINPNVPKFSIGDPLRIKQVLLNLITNAIKFTHEGFVNIKCKVLSETESAYMIQFQVIDSGIGIPLEKQKSIFESFTQVDFDTNREYGGTGLGLAISKGIVNLLKGTIQVESTLGFGSCFTVVIPLIKGEKHEEIQAEIIPNAQKLEKLKHKTVLLVEDNKINQMLFKKMLAPAELTIHIANNGMEALKFLGATPVDIVFMDLHMPVLDGYKATALIRSGEIDVLNPNVPIIALTADAYEETKEKAMLNGMNAFISKPFDLQRIIEAVNELQLD